MPQLRGNEPILGLNNSLASSPLKVIVISESLSILLKAEGAKEIGDSPFS
jgi:hypothetical protein